MKYRHSSHAGNHGDVLKHVVYLALLRKITREKQSVSILDTHAGVGRYALLNQVKEEYREGALRVWNQNIMHSADNSQQQGNSPAIEDYIQVIRSFNEHELTKETAKDAAADHPESSLTLYPGSPAFVLHLIKEKQLNHGISKVMLCEMNPSVFQDLKIFINEFGNDHSGDDSDGTKIDSIQQDGFQVLEEHPSATSLDLVLIDPPYESPKEYQTTIQAIQKHSSNNNPATIMVWVPFMKHNKEEATNLQNALNELPCPVDVYALRDVPTEKSLTGSAVIILNPPEGLRQELDPAIEWLKTCFQCQ